MRHISIICLVLCAMLGCQSYSVKHPANPKKLENTAFLKVENRACILKYGSENKVYCECFSGVKSKIIPDPLKVKILKGDSSAVLESFQIMMSNKAELDTCDKFAKARVQEMDLSIPDFEIPPLAKKVLSQTKYPLLTPSNRKLSKPKLPIGYEFHMNVATHEPYPRYTKRLTSIKDDAYFFTNIHEDNVRHNNKKYEYGIEYYLPIKDVSVSEYKVSGSSKCVFELNKPCEFYRYSRTKKYQMYTIFKDGMWVSIEPATFSKSRNLIIRIFSDDGLPLYIYEKSLKKNNTIERLRFEPDTTWLEYQK